MAGTGAGYDLSVSTFSPDGRVFQVEYACKAVDSSGLCMAARCRDGVLFLVEKPKPSPLLLASSMRRIHAITEHIGMATVGLPADGRQLVKRAREEAADYLRIFGVEIEGAVLAERLALYMHAYSLYWSVRPFGAAALIGAVVPSPPSFHAFSRSSSSSRDTPPHSRVSRTADHALSTLHGEIYCVDPSGCCSKYMATAVGKGRPSAKTALEKLELSSMSTQETLVALLKICLTVNDDERERSAKLQIEAARLSEETGGRFVMIPEKDVTDAMKTAREAIEAQERDEDDDEDI